MSSVVELGKFKPRVVRILLIIDIVAVLDRYGCIVATVCNKNSAFRVAKARKCSN